MDKPIKLRVRELENKQGGSLEVGYVNMSVEDWEAGNIPDSAKGKKIYIGISPDNWDEVV